MIIVLISVKTGNLLKCVEEMGFAFSLKEKVSVFHTMSFTPWHIWKKFAKCTKKCSGTTAVLSQVNATGLMKCVLLSGSAENMGLAERRKVSSIIVLI